LEVGKKIKRYLQDNGISQAFVSRKIGITATKLNLSLNGERKLTFEEYEKICGALGVNTDMFLKPRNPADCLTVENKQERRKP
jgi:transcriptional regulator with XRE-family HTH domain